jgi:hypothetical protein
MIKCHIPGDTEENVDELNTSQESSELDSLSDPDGGMASDEISESDSGTTTESEDGPTRLTPPLTRKAKI